LRSWFLAHTSRSRVDLGFCDGHECRRVLTSVGRRTKRNSEAKGGRKAAGECKGNRCTPHHLFL
jgi:hypothetical protein